MAKLDLLELQGTQEMQQSQTQLSAIVADANSCDPWTSRARPSFLYVRYVMILWALPMGVLSAFRPDTTRDIAIGMNAYLGGLPEQLYTLRHRLPRLHRDAPVGGRSRAWTSTGGRLPWVERGNSTHGVRIEKLCEVP